MNVQAQRVSRTVQISLSRTTLALVVQQRKRNWNNVGLQCVECYWKHAYWGFPRNRSHAVGYVLQIFGKTLAEFHSSGARCRYETMSRLCSFRVKMEVTCGAQVIEEN
jgi:hypothetical protein